MLNNVIQQEERTEEDLIAAGFKYYHRRKQLVMARVLPDDEAPLILELPWDTLIAEAGYYICYDPGDVWYVNRDSYDRWAVRPDIFESTYNEWDVPDWQPNKPESYLMSFGCKPYYKFAGVWAKRLIYPTYIRSLESKSAALIPAGAWLAIGVKNAPWHIEDKEFRSRYQLSDGVENGA